VGNLNLRFPRIDYWLDCFSTAPWWQGWLGDRGAWTGKHTEWETTGLDKREKNEMKKLMTGYDGRTC